MRPPVRYAKSGTLNIAYQVTGSGSRDLVLIPRLRLSPRSRLGGAAACLLSGTAWLLFRLDPLRQARHRPFRSPGRPSRSRDADGRRARRHGRGRQQARRSCSATPRAVPWRSSLPPPIRSGRRPWSSTGPLLADLSARTIPGERPGGARRICRAGGERRGLGSGHAEPVPNADKGTAEWWGERSRAAASPGAARALIEMNS